MYAEGDFIRINPKSVSYIKDQLLQIIQLFVEEDNKDKKVPPSKKEKVTAKGKKPKIAKDDSESEYNEDDEEAKEEAASDDLSSDNSHKRLALEKK